MALAAGSTVGPYRIVGPLGRGGMASVYEAYEAALDRHVALKVLPREFLHDPDFAERSPGIPTSWCRGRRPVRRAVT